MNQSKNSASTIEISSITRTLTLLQAYVDMSSKTPVVPLGIPGPGEDCSVCPPAISAATPVGAVTRTPSPPTPSAALSAFTISRKVCDLPVPGPPVKKRFFRSCTAAINACRCPRPSSDCGTSAEIRTENALTPSRVWPPMNVRRCRPCSTCSEACPRTTGIYPQHFQKEFFWVCTGPR